MRKMNKRKREDEGKGERRKGERIRKGCEEREREKLKRVRE